MSLATDASGATGEPSEGGTPSENVFVAYRSLAGAYDEMIDAELHLRPAWRRFMAVAETSADGVARQSEQVRRMLRENGVTYNVYGEDQSDDRAWELDSVPMLLGGDEWTRLADGLTQRATLLNLILIDLYGRQDLLKQGLIPPELVFGHPGYLLPCHGIRVPNDCYLHLSAAHLARGADGNWLVLADRTQAPSGAGYAVENRLVVSRVLAETYHESRIRRLATFFKTVRDSLYSAATRHRENPRVVLLTPGPGSSAYFEDAYLSRYLGFTLVEGGDLTVRDNAVYLKTLGGLLPVDVVLRRLQDDDCDPLELRGETMLGVPGLVQAARQGNVVVANALGCGILESPALAALLPQLCRHVLGEELRLPSVPTWWCGIEEHRKYALSRLPQLVVRHALLHRRFQPIVAGSLSAVERERLAEQIRKNPAAYAVQELVERSTCPVAVRGGLQPRHVALRTFIAAAGDKYEVMPGGLLRHSADATLLGPSVSAGQGSKDLWVLADGPVAHVSLLQPPGASIELRRSSHDLPSRVADNMFWLGRQLERAEGIVRQLRCLVSRLISESEPGSMPEIPVLFQALLHDWRSDAPSERDDDDPYRERRAEIIRLLYDETRADSLRSTIHAVHRLAVIVRDRLSIDSFRIIGQLAREIDAAGNGEGETPLGEILSQLNQLILPLAAFSGLGMESMTRGPGWRFLDIGRRIERALHGVRLLAGTLVRPLAEPQPVIESLLEIADSSMTYRARYLTSIQMPPALDLLLTDESNPRSAAFQINALAQHVNELPREEGRPKISAEQRIVQAVQTDLVCTDVESLCAAIEPDTGELRRLGELLSRLDAQLNSLAEAVTHSYLIHAGPSHRLGRMTVPTLE